MINLCFITINKYKQRKMVKIVIKFNNNEENVQ